MVSAKTSRAWSHSTSSSYRAASAPRLRPPTLFPTRTSQQATYVGHISAFPGSAFFASASPRYAASASRRAVTLPTTHVLISRSRARLSGHLHTIFERVRHCLGRYISRVYRIPPRAARTAGVIRSVYTPSGSERDTAFALPRTPRYTPRAALKLDTAFAMHPYPSVYAPSSSKAGTAIALHAAPIGIRPERPATRYCARAR